MPARHVDRASPGLEYRLRAPLASDDARDLLSSAFIDDPHPVFARLRAEAPLARIGDSGVHIVATWDLIEEALAREEDFSANLTGLLVLGEDGQPAAIDLPDTGATQVIATADEPRHAVHRNTAQPRFAPSLIAKLEPSLREWTQASLTPRIAEGGGNFVPLSEIVPARAVALLLGLPDGDVSRFRMWAMMGGDMLAGAITPEQMTAFGNETGRMVQYLHGHFAEALEAPREGVEVPLLHTLARAVRAGTIDTEEAIGISVVMFGAGGESTAALIGNALRLLAERPDLAETLRATPELLPRFVEEVVRLESPFKFHYRAVRRPCTLGGHTLEPGDRLMLAWASANRDAAHFDEPDTLRLDRRHPKLHMGFGRGRHFCIGANLARLEARIVCEAVLRGTRELALDPTEPPAYARSIFVRRHEALPLALEAAA